MNRADVEMVTGQMDNLANTFARNRALDQERNFRQQEVDTQKMRTQADIDFRTAQRKHYEQIENQQAGNENVRLNQQQIAQKQQLLQTALHLNATGQLDDDAIDAFNDWLKNDDTFKVTGIQISKPSVTNGKSKDAAIVNALKTAQEWRRQAAESDDEKEAQKLNEYADMSENWVKRQGSFKPAEGYTEEDTTPVIDSITKQQAKDKDGNLLFTKKTKTRTPFATPAAAPASMPGAAPRPAAANFPTLPARPADRQHGQTYQSAVGPVVWDAQNAVLKKAPQIAVPGFGAAQPPGQ